MRGFANQQQCTKGLQWESAKLRIRDPESKRQEQPHLHYFKDAEKVAVPKCSQF